MHVAYFIKDCNPNLAKPPSRCKGGSAKARFLFFLLNRQISTKIFFCKTVLGQYDKGIISNTFSDGFINRDKNFQFWVWINDLWWCHQMETFSSLPTMCAGNSPITDELPAQRPVTQSFDVFFDLRLNIRLSKQSWGWWFETLSRPLWRHCNVYTWNHGI